MNIAGESLKPQATGFWLSSRASLTGLAAQALGEAKRLQPNLSVDWVDKYHPIVRIEDRAMYIDGLHRAGLQ
jgi:adenylate cyclase